MTACQHNAPTTRNAAHDYCFPAAIKNWSVRRSTLYSVLAVSSVDAELMVATIARFATTLRISCMLTCAIFPKLKGQGSILIIIAALCSNVGFLNSASAMSFVWPGGS